MCYRCLQNVIGSWDGRQFMNLGWILGVGWAVYNVLLDKLGSRFKIFTLASWGHFKKGSLCNYLICVEWEDYKHPREWLLKNHGHLYY